MVLLIRVVSYAAFAAGTFAASYIAYRLITNHRSVHIVKYENKPLERRRIWHSKMPVSRSRVLHCRTLFWTPKMTESKTGNIWAILQELCEIYNVENVQKVLDKNGLTLPNGTMEIVCDKQGNRYDIPIYCISYPKNLLRNDDALRWNETHEEEEEEVNDIKERGKQVLFRVRLPNHENDISWTAYELTTIAELKQDVDNYLGVKKSAQRCSVLLDGVTLNDTKTIVDANINSYTVVVINI